MKKSSATCAVLLAFLTVLSSCTAEPPGERQFTIRADSRTTFVFDEAGNIIPPEQQFTVLYDTATGEPQCKKQEHVEDTGQDDEYGNPVLRRTYALYDMEGNLLYDYAETDYGAGFGDFLIRQDPRGFIVDLRDLPEDYHSELWNFKTGAPCLDGVGSLQVLDERRKTFLLKDVFGYVLGVVDREGSVISGFPPPEGVYYSTAWNGRILSRNHPFDYEGPEEEQDVLLTDKLEPVFSARTLDGDFSGLRGNYLLCDGKELYGVLDENGKLLYTVPEGEDLEYFDGKRVILRTGDPSDGFTFRLARTDGAELASGYEELQAAEPGGNQSPAQKFIGRRGETVDLIDRNGRVTASREIPGITGLNPLGGGLFSYSAGENSEGLLDENLDVLIQPGRYCWIRRCTDWENGRKTTFDLLECAYYLAGNPEYGSAIQRRDLLELPSLNKIVSGLSTLYDIGPDRLAVARGFSVGLMDWEGNWIVQKSVFQNLNDDYDNWSAYL